MDRKTKTHHEARLIAFLAPPELIADADAIAASEGISRSDVARRALLRDLRTTAGAA